MPFNLFNWLALMLVLGVGANYAVFLREGALRADDDLGAVWTGVLLSAATTLLSFGMLGISAMPALRASARRSRSASPFRCCLRRSACHRKQGGPVMNACLTSILHALGMINALGGDVGTIVQALAAASAPGMAHAARARRSGPKRSPAA